ncbi:amino acid transporter [Crucibulum laeve]|uniref:Amino acid transporter n=1 Tax=Crucibulum laeve TaxID=68775 RepID=A0A5C3LXZ8_9AGAR|nr:amino acid transporter [Crucibulum laeve]
MSEMADSDALAAQGLQKLGYQQELTRSRGLLHMLFMALAIMAVPFGIVAPIFTSLIGGGPVTMLWGWVLVSFLSLPTALSLAEICSKYPTSAGAYYWVFRLSSPRYRVLFSWINGWLTMVGVWTISLAVTFGSTQLLVAGISIFKPEFAPLPWQTYLLFLAVTVVATVFGLFFNGALPTIDIMSAVWTLLGLIVIAVCLPVKSAVRHPASYVFTHFDATGTGWAPGVSFLIGLLPPACTYVAVPMITNMAEEVHSPSVHVPAALVWSIPIGAVCGILFLLPIIFTLPDIGILLSVPTGQPIGLMYELIMGSPGAGFAMWFIVFGTAMFCAISICCAASRATWSFARDKAIPFHGVFSKVNHKLGVPINAYLLSTIIQLLLGLLYLGSSTAFNAFVGVAIICLGASYAMPILISVLNGRKDMEEAPFSLGKWGFLVNILAVLWVGLEIVIFSMPVIIPTTVITMNYAAVIFVGFTVISSVWYLVDGRYRYTGPPLPEDISNRSPSVSSTNEKDES